MGNHYDTEDDPKYRRDSHLIDDEFQSNKYPTTPRGKVPLSVRDPTAQDLLWEYAQRRRSVDAEFSNDLEQALRIAGYLPRSSVGNVWKCPAGSWCGDPRCVRACVKEVYKMTNKPPRPPFCDSSIDSDQYYALANNQRLDHIITLLEAILERLPSAPAPGVHEWLRVKRQEAPPKLGLRKVVAWDDERGYYWREE